MEAPKYTMPKGYSGHIPEPVSQEELQANKIAVDRFDPPEILSNYELEQQLGPNGSSINPLWFLINPFKLPCAKRALVIGITVGGVIGGSSFFRSKLPHVVLRNFGLGFGAGSIISLLQCRKTYNEQLKYNPLSVASRMEYAQSPEEYVKQALKSGASPEQIERIKSIVGNSR